jgi:hypothetical protein
VASLSTSMVRRAQVEARAVARLLLGQRPRAGAAAGRARAGQVAAGAQAAVQVAHPGLGRAGHGEQQRHG